MLKLRILDDVFDDGSLLFDRTNDAPDTDVRPDDRCVWMSFEEILDLLRVCRFRPGFRERNVYVAVNQDHQADFTRKIDQPIKRLVLQTRYFSGNLRRDRLPTNLELTDPAEPSRQ